MQEMYNILTVVLGVPSPPDRPFTYEYKDENEKAQSRTGTPREYYEQSHSEKYPPTMRASVY